VLWVTCEEWVVFGSCAVSDCCEEWVVFGSCAVSDYCEEWVLFGSCAVSDYCEEWACKVWNTQTMQNYSIGRLQFSRWSRYFMSTQWLLLKGILAVHILGAGHMDKNDICWFRKIKLYLCSTKQYAPMMWRYGCMHIYNLYMRGASVSYWQSYPLWLPVTSLNSKCTEVMKCEYQQC
jgi:hypothetical protein